MHTRMPYTFHMPAEMWGKWFILKPRMQANRTGPFRYSNVYGRINVIKVTAHVILGFASNTILGLLSFAYTACFDRVGTILHSKINLKLPFIDFYSI